MFAKSLTFKKMIILSKKSHLQETILTAKNLHKEIQYQVFLSNTNNVCTFSLECSFLILISKWFKVFADGPDDRGSIPDQVIPTTQKNGT